MPTKKASRKKKRVTVKTSDETVSAATRAPGKKKTSAKKKTQSRAKPGTAGKKSKKKTSKKAEGLASEAVRIVEQAASILQEEISAGVVAAKRVEEKYLNVSDLRSGDPQEVMQRFRNDAHEVLDIVMDLINLSINAVSGLSERAMNIRSTTVPNSGENGAKNEGSLPELIIPGILRPGESGKVGMLVENENAEATGVFQWSTSGLLSATGNHLAAEHVNFGPDSLEIDAHDLEKVNITVSIPEGTQPGQYSGVVQAAAIQVRALLTVQVKE